jgi:signal transduction histidine kinase
MDTVLPLPAERLLTNSGLVVIQVDAHCNLLTVHNGALLSGWLPSDTSAEPGAGLASLLAHLLEPPQIEILLQRCAEPLPAQIDSDSRVLTSAPGKPQRLAAHRYFDIWIEPLQGETTQTAVILADVSARHSAIVALEEARADSELAVTLLRCEVTALRMFLRSAQTGLAKIRSTLKMPARTQDTLRDKLSQLLAEARSLQAGAETLGLRALTAASQQFADPLQILTGRDTLSGDDLLPLTPRIDAISAAIGAAVRIDEQRPETSGRTAKASGRTITRKALAWPEASELRWSEYLCRRGEQVGKLARLRMNGAQSVPTAIRRQVDEILEPLLGNALEHGIELPEKRLEADKPAAGQVTVSFESGAGGLEMTVHDDGYGFDLDRIGRAAVTSGILTEESLAATDPGALVGLVFKPAFTTAGLEDSFSQGRGMSSVRTAISRLGGHISVATKQRRYTMFTIRLPTSRGAQRI